QVGIYLAMANALVEIAVIRSRWWRRYAGVGSVYEAADNSDTGAGLSTNLRSEAEQYTKRKAEQQKPAHQFHSSSHAIRSYRRLTGTSGRSSLRVVVRFRESSGLITPKVISVNYFCVTKLRGKLVFNSELRLVFSFISIA